MRVSPRLIISKRVINVVTLSLLCLAPTYSQAVPGNFNTTAGFAAQQTPDTDPTYVLGPDDVIALAVLKHPEFSGEFLIPANGVVDLPIAGPTQLSGKSIEQVRLDIMVRLKKRLLKPEFTLTLKVARARRVYALGDLRNPGTYDFKPGWRVAQVVAAAGGLAPSFLPGATQPSTQQISDATVNIVSQGEQVGRQISLEDALKGDPKANLVIKPGDVITVSNAKFITVYVLGKVAIPGVKMVRMDQAGILAVISMAGGPTVDAVPSEVKIRHRDGVEETVNLVPILFKGEDRKPLPDVKSGDIIIVPESLQRIAVLGMVRTPGVFPIQDGRPLTMADAIALAQGPDVHRARLSRVGLMRALPNGKGARYTINFGDYLSKGDPKLNPILRPGDIVFVPETNSIDWNIILGTLGTFSNLYYNYSVIH